MGQGDLWGGPPRREDQSNPPAASSPNHKVRRGQDRDPPASRRPEAKSLLHNGLCTALLPIRAPGQQRTKLGYKLLELASPGYRLTLRDAHPAHFSARESMTLQVCKWRPHSQLGGIGLIPGSPLYGPGLRPSPQH